METQGKLVNATRNLITGKMNITFEVNDVDLNALTGIDLDIKAEKHHSKRSMNANAYFHVLCGKIAGAVGISTARTKNILLARYGEPELLPSGDILYYKTNCPTDVMLESESVHAMPAKFDGLAIYYKIMRGSHTYNTAEMARLIDGTVSEAKDLGIETVSPTELERIKALWQGNRH